MKISVLESGSWGTALAVSLFHNGHDVTLHSVYENRSDELRALGENKYLPGVKLPEGLKYSDTFDGIPDADAVFFVTPSFAVRKTAAALRGIVHDDTILVSCSKGIESGTSLTLSQVILDELGGEERIAAISGPSHAEEVGRLIPTGLVSASKNPETAQRVQDMLMSSVLRVYTSDDILGIELCAALKNVIAISVGICDGLGYGDNTMAMLMTRGLNEMASLGVALGGKRDTFWGLAGVGDLIVTCTSRHSRNRRAGLYIGQGASAEEARAKVGATVEGYYAVQSAMELSAKYGVDMPIASQLYQVLFKGKDPRIATSELMLRTKKPEHPHSVPVSTK